MKFREGLFVHGHNVLIADEVDYGMILCLSKNRYFYVAMLEKEFINDEVAKLYQDDEVVPPQHTSITFYDEDDNEITNVPGTALVIAFTRIDGTHNPR